MTFKRSKLAQSMAEQLMKPSFLDQSLRSGLFLSGQRRVGKTTFLANDLIPALQALGALVIYVDLWSQPDANPGDLVHDAIKRALKDLQTPGSAVVAGLRRLQGVDVGAAAFKFGFKLADLGKEGGVSLAQAFTEVVKLAKTNVVLIVDEVQHALGKPDGDNLLLALKAARDAINTRPDPPGYFLFIGTGSHRARVQELAVKGKQAFNGAITQDFPVLEKDFVVDVLRQIGNALGANTPSVDAVYQAFQNLGHRPEELMKALSVLRELPPGIQQDEHLLTISATLRSRAADLELQRIDNLGPLARAIFARICGLGGDVKGVFSADAVESYATQLGRKVSRDEVQPMVNALMDDNLLMRVKHGHYGVTDAFIETAWNEREQASKALRLGGLAGS